MLASARKSHVIELEAARFAHVKGESHRDGVARSTATRRSHAAAAEASANAVATGIDETIGLFRTAAILGLAAARYAAARYATARYAASGSSPSTCRRA